jgi:hypothetical protein
LNQLAFHHVLREFDQYVQNLEVALVKRHLKRLHVQPVAGKHAAVVAPLRIRRRTAPSRVGAVNHVVMD